MNLYLFKAKCITFFCCLLFMQTALFAQGNVRINLKGNEITLREALTEIEKQSKMSVAYNESQLGGNKRISLNINNQTLEQALDAILKGTGFGYKLKDGYIMITPVKQDTPVAKQIRGKVVDEQGEALIGVNVSVDGTDAGTITNIDGEFSIQAVKNATLKISYIGYATQSIKVQDRDIYNITLIPDTKVLDEVVVTALGIKRAEKALSYNVQQVKSYELTTVKSANFMNALVGKVAGATINTSASGPGGAVKVVMRGAKSISQSNNALYVIDGIPMYNSSVNSDVSEGALSAQPGSESAADINPDDIESMTLLTGPSAAALYGYEGANGVVLITTKKGRADKTVLTFSNNTTFSSPLMMPKFQNTYGNVTGETTSWGEKTDYRYDPKKFFNTGSNVSNSVSLATGNDKSQTYISASVNNSAGILPNNKYNRYNFLFRNTTSFINNKLILDVSANYVIQNSKNMVSQGQYFNPLPALYLFPRGEDFDEVRIYERYDELMGVNNQYWPYGDQGLSIQNPYWIMNRMDSKSEKRRYKLAAGLQYIITDWLNVQGRVNVDNSDYRNTEERYAGTLATFAGSKGRYSQGTRSDRQIYADVLANINKTFNDFSLSANLGASIKDIRMESNSLIGDLKNATNYFTAENMDRTGNFKIDDDGLKRQTQSIFANVELGYRHFLYLTLTARNDWDSALAFSESGDKSFMYPSVGLSGIISEVVKLPDWFTFLKARLSFTSVGSSYAPYLTREFYEYNDQANQYEAKSLYPNRYLKPEITNSFEAGLNMKFFRGALNFDITYYQSDTRHQTFVASLPGGSGYEGVNIQAGNVQNKGIEMALGYQSEWAGFSWASNVTFTYNKNKVKKLADGVRNTVTGELIQMPYVDKATLGSTGSPIVRLTEGGTMGDIYVNRDFQRDDNGYVYLNPTTFLPSMVNTEYKKVGSLLPKVNMGWRNSFSYKGVRLNVLLTGRFGGNVVSNTQAVLDRYGVSEYSAKLREQDNITINQKKISARDYLNIVAAGTGQGAHYIYKATNIRLQEVSVEYTIPRKKLYNIADVTLGVVGNNLGMIYCKAPFDPELVASATNTYYTGVDYFMQPSLRNIGFSLKLQF